MVCNLPGGNCKTRADKKIRLLNVVCAFDGRHPALSAGSMIVNYEIKKLWPDLLANLFPSLYKLRQSCLEGRTFSPMQFCLKPIISSGLLIFVALLCGPGISTRCAATDSGRMLKVFTCEDEAGTHFYIQNLELADVTATLDLRLTNMKGSAEFPYTTTLAGNQTVEVFTLAPITEAAPWKYSYVRSSVIGSATAVHDDSYIYSLPYAPGASFHVSQGYHGGFSHTGPDEYAVDWEMPEGTPVHAAREGLVVKSEDSMNQGGADRKYEKYANSVVIQHADGTIGIYGHLKKGGNQVKVGDRVKTGDPIALSGNTGFTSGPHLHFSVSKAKDGWERESLPVKFRSADHGVMTLAAGESYQAAPPEVPPVMATASLASNK